jgi:hypothetical protein
LALIIITDHHEKIFRSLYSPTAVVIAIIMLVEYLILKGSDRTEIYRRELEAARQRRRDDLLALRNMESQLVDLRSRLASELERYSEGGPPRESAEQTHHSVEQLLELLRGRI